MQLLRLKKHQFASGLPADPYFELAMHGRVDELREVLLNKSMIFEIAPPDDRHYSDWRIMEYHE